MLRPTANGSGTVAGATVIDSRPGLITSSATEFEVNPEPDAVMFAVPAVSPLASPLKIKGDGGIII